MTIFLSAPEMIRVLQTNDSYLVTCSMGTKSNKLNKLDNFISLLDDYFYQTYEVKVYYFKS